MRVLLDAGHYGRQNQSPVASEYYESEVMWDLHLLLKMHLESYGIFVNITRSSYFQRTSVYNRGIMAKGYDLFISLHSNAADDESVDRVDVYCPWDNRNDSAVLGASLAEGIADIMEVSYGQTKTRPGRQREYYGVLRGAADAECPMYFLIEHSFHTNKRAAEWLLNTENLYFLAKREAEIIAEHYGFKAPELPGDVNGNGKFDTRDYILAKRIYFGTYTPTDEELKRCDIDGDGKVSARDYLLIKRAVLGQ